MDEDVEPEPGRLGPERVELRRIEPDPVELGGDDDAREAELVGAARELSHCVGPAERMGMRGADEAAGISARSAALAASLQSLDFSMPAHMPSAQDSTAVPDPRRVHHLDMGVEIDQQVVEAVGRHPVRRRSG